MSRVIAVMLLLVSIAPPLAQAAGPEAEPDYSAWTAILRKYYDPAKGMDYAALKARDFAAVQSLRRELGRVNAAALDRKQQLAYWINVYNVNIVATVLENYPVKSIRDISTDLIVRLNVFKKPRVPFGSVTLSLDDVENDKIRAGFHDPRIHFAINCAAKSCPPMRAEAFSGATIDQQLDDQARRFLGGPLGVRIGRKGDALIVHASKILDWFGDDFEKWSTGRIPFIRRYVPADKQRLIDAANGRIELEFDDYDWSLNDWQR
ncbi:MAG TPA: DUF547 domain-containing protein [Thermoanaerobaculia bacterium]|nr:DUF547 domain-containing protein [Thermoanaerobaculia bacterium]